MGISSKKQTSTSTTNQNTTMNTTPTNPDWVTNGISGLADKINSTFSGLDPHSLVAGADPLQQQAASGAAGLTGTPWNYSGALDLTSGVAQGNSPQTAYVDSSGLINKFMNPYMKDVVNSSLADYNQGAGQTRAQNQLSLAGDTTFGGSGGAIQTSLSNDAIDRGRASLVSGLRSQGYTQALNAAQSEAARQQGANDTNAQLLGQGQDRTLAAAGQIANISDQFGANQRADIATQAGLGGTLRDITDQQNHAPITSLLSQIAAYGGLPLDLFKGSDSTGSLSGTTNTTGKTSGASLGDWLNYMASNAQAAAGAGG